MVVDRELANMQASLSALATSPSLVSGDLRAFYRQAQGFWRLTPVPTSSLQTRPVRSSSIHFSHLACPCLSAASRMQFGRSMRQVGRLSPTSSRAL
jgi:hypothetical protein